LSQLNNSSVKKTKRDHAEQQLRDRHLAQQQLEWQQQKTSGNPVNSSEELEAVQTGSSG